MSIDKFATEALIVSSYTVGESDVLLNLYTKEFGLILAKATSLKKSKKLRSHLIVGRVSHVTLVKGKDTYRIVGSFETDKKSEVFFHVIECIKRFFHGEEKNAYLFDRLMSYTEIKDANSLHLRTCIYLDVLISLGYLDTNKLNLSRKDYELMDVNSFYIFTFLKKDECVRIIRESTASSML